LNRYLIAAVLLTLAACAPASTATPQPPQRNPPTLEAPAWSESAEAITVDNAARLALLGRLDQPETSATLFDHAVSPDGIRLAALNNDEILAWDLLTGQLVFHTARSNATRLFYSSDKTELYAVDPNALTLILNAETGSTVNTLTGHNRYAGIIAFDPQNDRLAFGGSDGTVKVWEMFERQSLRTLNAHSASVTALAFSGDGSLLATASADGSLRLWDWQNGQQAAELTVEGDAPQRLVFSADDAQIAFGAGQGVSLWSPGSSFATPLANRVGANPLLLYSTDGQFLLTGARASGLALWNPQTNAQIGALLEATGNQISADFSPDSRMLLTSALGGEVSLWNLTGAAGTLLSRADLSTGEAQIYAVEWTDDGRLLLLFDATGPVYAWGIGAAQ
jgi:WD40 repeat protein